MNTQAPVPGSSPNVAISPGILGAYDLDRKGGGVALTAADLHQPIPEGCVRWVHVDFSKPDGRDWLQQDSGIDETITEAMLQEDIRPRSLQTPAGILTILRGVNLNPGSQAEDMVSIRIWLEKNRIITARRRRLMSVQQIQEDLHKGHGPAGPGDFLSTLVYHLVERIAEVIDSIEDSIEQCEVSMASQRSLNYRGEFGNLRRKTAHFRRYLSPQREALDRLSRMQSDILTPVDLAYMQEETNRMTLFVEELDLSRERAMVAQEEMLSSLAHEQNSKMYLLSLVAAVFLPLSFLTGLFGMNVAGLPGTQDPLSFLIISVIMVAIGVAILLVFRLKRWL